MSAAQKRWTVAGAIVLSLVINTLVAGLYLRHLERSHPAPEVSPELCRAYEQWAQSAHSHVDGMDIHCRIVRIAP